MTNKKVLGCGNWFKSFGNGRVGVDTQCGYQYRKNTKIHLCPSCQSKKDNSPATNPKKDIQMNISLDTPNWDSYGLDEDVMKTDTAKKIVKAVKEMLKNQTPKEDINCDNIKTEQKLTRVANTNKTSYGDIENQVNYFHNKFKDEGKYIGKRFIREIINTQQRKKDEKTLSNLSSGEHETTMDKANNTREVAQDVDTHSADIPNWTLDKQKVFIKDTGLFFSDDVRLFLKKLKEEALKYDFWDTDRLIEWLKLNAGQNLIEGDEK